MRLHLLVVTLHLLAALFWLGGMFFLAAVGAPVLRRLEDPTLRRDLFQALGRRFRDAGWIAVGVLLLTGVWNLHLRGVLRPAVLLDPAFWRSPFGSALGWKLGLVSAMVALQGWHDFVLGPRAGAAGTGTPEALRLRRQAALMARTVAALGLVLVWVAVRLGRGG